MDDVAPALLAKIEELFRERFYGDKKIAALYEKVDAGTASYEEANDFAVRVGELLARIFGEVLSDDVLPDGKMYYNIAQRVVRLPMEHNFELVRDVCLRVQEGLNASAKIGIKAIAPKLNDSRISGIVDRLTEAEKYSDVKWILDEPVVNFTQSTVDDSIQENAMYHYEAGLAAKVVRTVVGGCCDWCAELAGTYDIADAPKGDDVWRRHERCRCTIEYVTGAGRRSSARRNWARDPVRIERRKTAGL